MGPLAPISPHFGWIQGDKTGPFHSARTRPAAAGWCFEPSDRALWGHFMAEIGPFGPGGGDARRLMVWAMTHASGL